VQIKQYKLHYRFDNALGILKTPGPGKFGNHTFSSAGLMLITVAGSNSLLNRRCARTLLFCNFTNDTPQFSYNVQKAPEDERHPGKTWIILSPQRYIHKEATA